MAATVWSGVIGFGMVSIPVKLFSATSSKRISFNQLHAKCMSRIKEVRWCPTCDVEVPWEEVVKGYEMAKDEYVAVTAEDFEQLPIPSKDTIDITSFTEAVDVDPLYFEKNYYLLPDKKGEKAFNLFLKALEAKALVAIGKIAIRSRERLCAIRNVDGNMVLCTLLYEDEIRVDLHKDDDAKPEFKIAKPELDMALTLIDIMTQPFDPASYKDDYQEAMSELLANKTKSIPGKKSKAMPSAAVGDLMEALKASLNTASQKRGGQNKTVKLTKPKTAETKIASPVVALPKASSRAKPPARKFAQGR